LEFRSGSCDAFKLDPTFALRSLYRSLLEKFLKKFSLQLSSFYASFASANEKQRFRTRLLAQRKFRGELLLFVVAVAFAAASAQLPPIFVVSADLWKMGE